MSVRGDGIKWYSSNCSEDKRYVCERGIVVDLHHDTVSVTIF